MNQKAETDKQKLAVELDLLKSKLNPHFLFNSLNNIDSLIHSDPEEASAALIRLSDIMRYLTYETTSEFVELRKEVEYIRNFIELYRIRVKSPEGIKLEIDANLDLKIAPALFVPLMENAFKFADYRNSKPFINIQLRTSDDRITFDISNFCRKNSVKPGAINSGYGIINLKKRLELTYPGRHLLKVNHRELQYDVTLTIDTYAN